MRIQHNPLMRAIKIELDVPPTKEGEQAARKLARWVDLSLSGSGVWWELNGFMDGDLPQIVNTVMIVEALSKQA